MFESMLRVMLYLPVIIMHIIPTTSKLSSSYTVDIFAKLTERIHCTDSKLDDYFQIYS